VKIFLHFDSYRLHSRELAVFAEVNMSSSFIAERRKFNRIDGHIRR